VKISWIIDNGNGREARCCRLEAFYGGCAVLLLRDLQEMYITVKGLNITGEQWATGVIIKLLETTHGQWLYCCMQIHDRVRVRGTQMTQ
jgi:hypothetical protein